MAKFYRCDRCKEEMLAGPGQSAIGRTFYAHRGFMVEVRPLKECDVNLPDERQVETHFCRSCVVDIIMGLDAIRDGKTLNLK